MVAAKSVPLLRTIKDQRDPSVEHQTNDEDSTSYCEPLELPRGISSSHVGDDDSQSLPESTDASGLLP